MNRKYRMLLTLIITCFSISLLPVFNPSVQAGEFRLFSQSPRLADRTFSEIIRNEAYPGRFSPLKKKFELYLADSGQRLGEVRLPAEFQTTRPLRLRQSLPIPGSADTSYRLHLEGTPGSLRVSIDDKTIFRGRPLLLPLRLPLPKFQLADSLAELALRIVPWEGGKEDFPRFMPVNLPRIPNGILLPPYLEEVSPNRISRLTAELSGREAPTVQIRFTIINTTTDWSELSARLRLKNGRQLLGQPQEIVLPDSAAPARDFLVEFPLSHLPLWQPDSARRVTAELTLYKRNTLADQKVVTLPNRIFSFSGSQLLLNQRPVEVKGLIYIYQEPTGSHLWNRRLVLEDLQKIKEAGFNAVRIPLLPLPEPFYDLTDSLGLLVFQELPFTPLERPEPERLKEMNRLIRSFLHNMGEHPSLVGLGWNVFLSNNSPEIRQFLEENQKVLAQMGILMYRCTARLNLKEIAANQIPLLLDISERNHLEGLLAHLKKQLPADFPVLAGAFGKAVSYRVDSTRVTDDLRQIGELYTLLNKPQNRQLFSGQFVLTWSDYDLQFPSLQAGQTGNLYRNTIGLLDLNRNWKPLGKRIARRQWTSSQTDRPTSQNFQLDTSVFVIIGLLNLLIFLAFYRSLLEFRHNVHRSIKKSHGFFTDLQERRYISAGESLFLMAVISVSGGVMAESLLYFFRNNLLADYLLSLIFVSPAAKELIVDLIWKPYLSVPLLSAINFSIFLFFAIPIRLLAFFRPGIVHTRQALAVSAWAGSPFLLLLPLGMVFYNLLLVLNSYWILIAVLLYFHAWFLLRWFSGSRVMLGLPNYRLIFGGALLVFLILAVLAGFWHSSLRVGDHLRFIWQIYQDIRSVGTM